MKKKMVIFTTGATGYCALELLYRGHTHWSMALLGGACFNAIISIHKKLFNRTIWLKAFISCGIITTSEFLTGLIVNKLFNWHVWDYSKRPGNILGQVCPLFSAIWYFLSAAIFFVLKHYSKRIK